MRVILGLSGLYHDSAAALLVDGKLVAAAQEERFTRIKHDSAIPLSAIDYVLEEASLSLSDVDAVSFYDKPFLKFERLLQTYIGTAPKGLNSFRMAMPVWLREKLFLKDYLANALKTRDEQFDIDKLRFVEHHYSHAASAFYPSPFEDAVVLTLDGVGEWATSSVAIGKGRDLEIVKQLEFPHSLGLLYSAFTYYTGFKVNSGEYKLMGLAPYGSPRFVDTILEHLVDVKPDGSFKLDQTYFNYASGLTMVNKRFCELFGEPVRQPDTDELTQFHMDIAASIQVVTEKIVLALARALREEYQIPNLCLAGGVALNCVANGKLIQEQIFDQVWVQPAAGDAGGAVGAAQAIWHNELGHQRVVDSADSMCGAYLGPLYNDDAIGAELADLGAIMQQHTQSDMLDTTAALLADGKAIGWFQGRMEFGPRALGGRSILSDPRNESMQKNLNLKIKFRESFRPFAPSILKDDVSEWFDFDAQSPYMLVVADVLDKHRLAESESQKNAFGIDRLNEPRSSVPAITHVDYSARIQTVDGAYNPAYHELLTRFKALTGCPILVNTSFNVRGEPIVCTPTDAFKCFMGTGMDALVIGNYVLHKSEQVVAAEDYTSKYELD